MTALDDIKPMASSALDKFHRSRIKKLEDITLEKFIKRMNPYALRALGFSNPAKLTQYAFAGHMYLSNATALGDKFFEAIVQNLPGFRASKTPGMDADRDLPGVQEIYQIKSGIHQLNCTEFAGVCRAFDKIRKGFGTHRSGNRLDTILGYAYGRTKRKTASCQVLAGQAFWTHVTGDSGFYIELNTLVGEVSRDWVNTYRIKWDEAAERVETGLLNNFCIDGRIDFDKFTRVTCAIDAQEEEEEDGKRLDCITPRQQTL